MTTHDADALHRRPPGTDDRTVEAVGKLSEALEWLERARGRLYDFHQMIGHLDLQMAEAAGLLRGAGHEDDAVRVEEDVIGRNVLDGRWTFQIIEEFEHLYYEVVKAVERSIRDRLMDGRRHVYESEMKERLRSRGRDGHESRPPAADDARVPTAR